MLNVHLSEPEPEKDILVPERRSILLTEDKKSARTKGHVLKRVFFTVPKKTQSLWNFTPFKPNDAIVERWHMFMLFPLGYEVWAFPYRLALGVPSISNQMAITPIDFACDVIFLLDMLVTLATSIPNPPGAERPITTFTAISRNYFRKIFPYQILPAFPFWVATFVATNHLQEPNQCGKSSSAVALYLNWSCVLKTLDWNIYFWWISAAVRVIPRLARLIIDFKAMESNLVRT